MPGRKEVDPLDRSVADPQFDGVEDDPSDSWRCGSCGEIHRGLAYSFGASAPDVWLETPPKLRGSGSDLTDETCMFRAEHFFIRGQIEIPVRDGDEPVFSWSVWTSVSRENFERAVAAWDSPDRTQEPPYFGWLSVELAPAYPPTTNLKLNLHTRAIGQRPFLEVEPTDHPLAVEQREGITVERVREINEILRHQ